MTDGAVDNYTYDPEIDFKDDPYVQGMWDFFHTPILHHIAYLNMKKGVQPTEVFHKLVQKPCKYTLRLFAGFSKMNDVIDAINKEEFQGEQVLFQDEDKLKNSEFFHVLAGLYDYIAHMPSFPQQMKEYQEYYQREIQKYNQFRNETMLIKKQ